jgi:type I restriction enzyme R subunit
MVKPHGFVLDFVGIIARLKKALRFDSDEVNAILKDINILKTLFRNKMDQKAPAYLRLIRFGFNDRDIDALVGHFGDPERRKAFFKEYKEIEMLYEIISPDAFLRPFINPYTTLSAIYAVVAKAYARSVDVDREFQRKTNALVQQHINTLGIDNSSETVLINSETIALIKAGKGSSRMKVVNLVKSIEREAKNNSDDPYLIAMAERARMVQNNFEERQTTTSEALDQLLDELAANQDRLKRQAEQGFDALTSFVYQSLLDAHIPNPEAVSTQIRTAFSAHPNWQSSEAALRELRQEITFALVAACEQLDQVTPLVEALFSTLAKGERLG